MSFNDQFDRVYHQAIKPAVEQCGYDCSRADKNIGPSNVPAEIIREIVAADLVIADVSEASPNVFYELGVSHSVGNKTVTIAMEAESLPFDIKTFRATIYKQDHEGLRLLQSDITNTIKIMETTQGAVPNNLVQEAGRDYFDLRSKVVENLESIKKQRRRLELYSEFLKRKDACELSDNSDVADRIVGQITPYFAGRRNNPILVCLAGPGAIGKSTFANVLAGRFSDLYASKYKVQVLPTDSYQMPRAERVLKNIIGYDHRSHRLEQMCEDIDTLIRGDSISIAPYDHTTGKPLVSFTIMPCDLLILEGVYSFYPTVAIQSPSLRYYIYANKHQAKELKFIADFMERGYDIQTAFSHSGKEYEAYEEHILPLARLADHVIEMDEYWKYKGPTLTERHLNYRVS